VVGGRWQLTVLTGQLGVSSVGGVRERNQHAPKRGRHQKVPHAPLILSAPPLPAIRPPVIPRDGPVTPDVTPSRCLLGPRLTFIPFCGLPVSPLLTSLWALCVSPYHGLMDPPVSLLLTVLAAVCQFPSEAPTLWPTGAPTFEPTFEPTAAPTEHPTGVSPPRQ
jgi:hypothetical protein